MENQDNGEREAVGFAHGAGASLLVYSWLNELEAKRGENHE